MADCLYHGYSGGPGRCPSCERRERGYPDPEFDDICAALTPPERREKEKPKKK